MAEAKGGAVVAEKPKGEKMVTLINSRKGKLMLAIPVVGGAENEVKNITVLSGMAFEVPESMAKRLIVHNQIVDASKMVQSPRIADLQAQLAKAQAENAELVKKLGEKEKGKDK